MLNLALQGGGAHGAFTWGVLDRILEDDRIEIKAVSATSAGAMNAVSMAYGMSIGGRVGAREKLHEFWEETSSAGQVFSPVRPSWYEKWLGFRDLDNSAEYFMFDALTHSFSPYQFNPLNFNPLDDVLRKVIDFEKLRACPRTMRLFLSATNIRTGRGKVFQNEHLTADTVLASACLPFLFQAVEIDGEAYWDGGYMGNPALYPLIYHAGCTDIAIVHINPVERPDLPYSASEIYNRINEISFNGSLLAELRAIEFVGRMLDEGRLPDQRYRNVRIHSIFSDELMRTLSVASKFSPDWGFLVYLRDAGRRTADAWLQAHYDDIGIKSSVDLRRMFL